MSSWWLEGIVVVAKVYRVRGLGFDPPQGFTPFSLDLVFCTSFFLLTFTHLLRTNSHYLFLLVVDIRRLMLAPPIHPALIFKIFINLALQHACKK